MKFSKQSRIIFALGLLLVSSGFLGRQFVPLPDVADGFMKGFGITLMLIVLIKERRYSQVNR